MTRYFVEISFRGTHYHGWQSQPNALTVQAEIESAIKMLTHEELKMTGAGRTDTGVHARYYVAHFDTDNSLPASGNDFLYKINAILPQDIAIHNIFPVKSDVHARYSAVSRTYQYTVSQVRNPFSLELSWYYPIPVDVAAMNEAAERLLCFTDFTSFSKLHSDVKNNLCQLYEARWTINGGELVFTIRGNRFLRNMVRSIVGTMIDLGRGKLKMDDFIRIIESRNRNMAGFSVPAKGLALVQVEYPADIRL